MSKKIQSQYGDEIPFLERKKEFIEMYGKFIVREKIGYIFGLLGILLAFVFGAWAMAVQRGITHEPYVILKDEIGQLTPLGVQNRTNNYVDDKVVKSELYKYILGLRYISTDVNVTQNNWFKTKRMTDSFLLPKMLNLLSQHLASISDDSWIDPKITDIHSYNGSKTWQIKWKEELNGKDDPLTNTYWNADITIEFVQLTNPLDLYENPAGIIVKNFKIDQIAN